MYAFGSGNWRCSVTFGYFRENVYFSRVQKLLRGTGADERGGRAHMTGLTGDRAHIPGLTSRRAHMTWYRSLPFTSSYSVLVPLSKLVIELFIHCGPHHRGVGGTGLRQSIKIVFVLSFNHCPFLTLYISWLVSMSWSEITSKTSKTSCKVPWAQVSHSPLFKFQRGNGFVSRSFLLIKLHNSEEKYIYIYMTSYLVLMVTMCLVSCWIQTSWRIISTYIMTYTDMNTQS